MNIHFWSMTFIVSSVLVCLISIANSSPFQRHFLHRRKQRLCGPELAEAVKFVCNGTYFNPESTTPNPEGKRYVLAYDPRVPVLSLIPSQYGFSDFREASSILSNREKRSARQRGIVEECCRKSCTFYHLRAYCGTNTTPQVEQIGRSLM